MINMTMVSMVTTQEGVTALYIASQEGHVTVVRLLLEKGANINICNKVVFDFGCMGTFSQLAVCDIYCMYVIYREQSVVSLHKHFERLKLRQFQQNKNPLYG